MKDWDVYFEYNRRDVALTCRIAEEWRAMEIQRIKDRWGIFWRIGLWLHDHLPRKPHYKRM